MLTPAAEVSLPSQIDTNVWSVDFRNCSLLAPGQALTVQGWGLTTPYAKVIDAQAVGTSPGQMSQVAPVPPPGYGYGWPAAPGGPPPR
jgi:hypothetical protein